MAVTSISLENTSQKYSWRVQPSVLNKCMVIAVSTLIGAAVGGVIGLTVLTVFPVSWPFWLFIGGGAVIGGLSGIAIESIIYRIKLNRYPASNFRKTTAIEIESLLTKKNYKLISIILEGFSTHCEWYPVWRGLINKSDSEIEDYLIEEFEKGLCAGTALALVELMRENADAECHELLNKCPLLLIFAYQMRWVIASDLSRMAKEQKTQATQEAFKTAIEDLFVYLQKALELKLDATENEFISCLSSKIDSYSITSLTLDLSYLGKDRGHIIFVQTCAGFYRFYDSLSIYTGFYEFKDRDTLLGYLYKHIHSYQNLSAITIHLHDHKQV